MNELISKEQALDALRTCYDTETITMDNGDEYIHYGDAVGEIEQLPPIQPRREERKIGEWIYDWGDWDFETCKCSECGNHMTTPIGERYNFCPNCGADMREVTT